MPIEDVILGGGGLLLGEMQSVDGGTRLRRSVRDHVQWRFGCFEARALLRLIFGLGIERALGAVMGPGGPTF